MKGLLLALVSGDTLLGRFAIYLLDGWLSSSLRQPLLAVTLTFLGYQQQPWLPLIALRLVGRCIL